MAKTESIEAQVKELLEQYDENFKKLVENVAESTAKQTAKDVKNNAIAVVGNGPYAKGWRATKTKGGWTVHNTEHYQLTHLLENGHAIANQWGSYGGRVAARRHIGPAEQVGIVRFEEEIRQGAQNL